MMAFIGVEKYGQFQKFPLSSRDHPMDMVMAMQMGADDFIQKPFHMDVLLAKIQAILRRTYDYKEEQTDLARWNDATIDYAKGTIQKGDHVCELTKMNYLYCVFYCSIWTKSFQEMCLCENCGMMRDS